MIKIFISHKQEDAEIAKRIAFELKLIQVDYYLDVLDSAIIHDGKALTNHIKKNLNQCTDILVVISEKSRYSQWVPFEVGMSAQRDMPTATYLQEEVALPDFLSYWPRLKRASDIQKYIQAREMVAKEYSKRGIQESYFNKITETQRFYEVLKPLL